MSEEMNNTTDCKEVSEEDMDMLTNAIIPDDDDSTLLERFTLGHVVELDIDTVSGLRFDKKSFQNGINQMSELCGMITALINVGIKPDKALSYLTETKLTKETMEHNIKVSQINADATIASSKNEYAVMQRNTI